MKNNIGLKNEFQEELKKFVIETHEKSQKTSDPIGTGISKILDSFLISKESYDNIRFQKKEFIDKITNFLSGKTLTNNEFTNLFNQALKLCTIFNTIQSYNKEYKESLEIDTSHITEAMKIIIGIHTKLKEGGKQ